MFVEGADLRCLSGQLDSHLHFATNRCKLA